MQLFETLTDDNFLLYAARNYYKPNVIDVEEFYDDLKRFKYLKRLFYRYQNDNQLSERLILNHLIVIFNVFDIEPSLRMLEFQIKPDYWPALKPFLIFLRHIRNDQYTEIPMDKTVVERLREI